MEHTVTMASAPLAPRNMAVTSSRLTSIPSRISKAHHPDPTPPCAKIFGDPYLPIQWPDTRQSKLSKISDHQQIFGYEDGTWKGQRPSLLVAAVFYKEF